MTHTALTIIATFIISVDILVPILQMRKWKPQEGSLLCKILTPKHKSGEVKMTSA